MQFILIKSLAISVVISVGCFSSITSAHTVLDVATWKGETLSTRRLETTVKANEAFEVDYKGAGPLIA